MVLADRIGVPGGAARTALVWLLLMAGMYLVAGANYLVFHTASEGFAILVAAMIFVLGTRSYRYSGDSFLLFLGYAYLFVALVDALHAATYKGMGILPGYGADTPTQLWIAARYIDSASLFLALLFLGRDFPRRVVLAIYAVATGLLVSSILWWGLFPTCYLEGVGLTPFKVASEYAVCLILLAALGQLHLRGAFLEERTRRLMAGAMVATILAELSFTLYTDVDGVMNFLGHLFKILAYYLIYRAIVLRGIELPHGTAVRLNRELEQRVGERTAELEAANQRLARQMEERGALEGRLLRAERVETAGRMAAQVAHDFNNLLGPICAYPELIRQELPPGAPARDYCYSMERAGREMAAINSKMLTIAGAGQGQRGMVDLNQLARDAVARLEAAPATLVIELELVARVSPVLGDPRGLADLLANLVTNAREAMLDVGNLTLRTRVVQLDEPLEGYNRIEAGSYVLLQVIDTGCGIPPEVMDRVFDPFFTTKRLPGGHGSGLGLAVAQAIVEDHQGFMDLESRIGVGSTFSVYLPAYQRLARET